MLKKSLFFLCLALAFTAPVLAALDELAWAWNAGDSCALWSAGCATNTNTAVIPENGQSNITLTSVSCTSGELTLVRSGDTATRTVVIQLGNTQATRDIAAEVSLPVAGVQSSTLTIANSTPYSLQLHHVSLLCAPVYPDVAGLSPIRVDTSKRTPFRALRTFTIWDVWDIGRYALTTWWFFNDSGYNKAMLLALVVLPLVVFILLKTMSEPPDV